VGYGYLLGFLLVYLNRDWKRLEQMGNRCNEVAMLKRKKIKRGEKIEISFSSRERKLLIEHTFADSEYTERLRPVSGSATWVGEYTLEDLDDLLGYIAAEANHAEDANLERKLQALYDRLCKIEDSYEEEGLE